MHAILTGSSVCAVVYYFFKFVLAFCAPTYKSKSRAEARPLQMTKDAGLSGKADRNTENVSRREASG